SVQPLAGGSMFIGCGRSTYFTQYGSAGDVQFDGHLGPAISSYRASLQPWSATPLDPPAVSIARSGADATLYASWNGATEVAQWAVLGGPGADALASIGVAPVMGFETAIVVPQAPPYLAICAYDTNGQLLSTSGVAS
ncbi:MAG: arylsulfotransferase family protein, partial [Solirubrobacteraceae bacterium]